MQGMHCGCGDGTSTSTRSRSRMMMERQIEYSCLALARFLPDFEASFFDFRLKLILNLNA